MKDQIKQLVLEIRELQESNKSLIASDDGKANEIKLDFIQTRYELNKAKEALTGTYIIDNIYYFRYANYDGNMRILYIRIWYKNSLFI